jgi:hypothetical protein
MSDSAPSRFFERLAQDEELARTYQTAVAKAVRSAVWPAIVEVAAKEGMAFSTDELGAWLAKQQEELSEEALQGVTGGIARPRLPAGTAGLVAAGVLGTVVVVGLASNTGSDDRGSAPAPISP